MKCAKCGAENANDALFCKSCGERLKEPEQPKPIQTVTDDAEPAPKAWYIPVIGGVAALIVLVVIIILLCKGCGSDSGSEMESMASNPGIVSSDYFADKKTGDIETNEYAGDTGAGNTEANEYAGDTGSGDVYVTVSSDDVSIPLGSSVTLSVSASGNLPDHFYFNVSCEIYHPDLNSEWGAWTSNNACDISITGLTVSEGPVTFYVYDSATDECLASTDIYIQVTDSTSVEAPDYTSWAEGYADTVREMKNDYPNLHFGICYIDNSEVPDLVIIPGNSHSDNVQLYTWSYDSNQVEHVGDFGCYGNLEINYPGMIHETEMVQGSVNEFFYSILGSNYELIAGCYYKEGETYKIDGETYSMEGYYNYIDLNIMSGHSATKVDYDSCRSSDENYINEFIENPYDFISDYYTGDGY